ncbi:hypothetical protein D3C73_800880 [compost metagenome]
MNYRPKLRFQRIGQADLANRLMPMQLYSLTPAGGFIEAQNITLSVFGRLHGIQHNMPAFKTGQGPGRRQPAALLSGSKHRHFMIQLCRFAQRMRAPPVSGMRIQGVGEFVDALVCLGIRPFRRAQQRQADRTGLNVVAVFAVIQQADAVAVLGHIGEPVAAHFILRLLPAGIAVRRPLQRTERNLVGCFISDNIDREANLQ